MTKPAQKLRVDERLEELHADRLIESPQPLGLLAGQPQSRHLQEFARHSSQQRIVDR
jgi:hypothetical protein